MAYTYSQQYSKTNTENQIFFTGDDLINEINIGFGAASSLQKHTPDVLSPTPTQTPNTPVTAVVEEPQDSELEELYSSSSSTSTSTRRKSRTRSDSQTKRVPIPIPERIAREGTPTQPVTPLVVDEKENRPLLFDNRLVTILCIH